MAKKKKTKSKITVKGADFETFVLDEINIQNYLNENSIMNKIIVSSRFFSMMMAGFIFQKTGDYYVSYKCDTGILTIYNSNIGDSSEVSFSCYSDVREREDFLWPTPTKKLERLRDICLTIEDQPLVISISNNKIELEEVKL